MPMAPRSHNKTRVTPPPGRVEGTDFWLSDPELMEDGEGEWGFAVYTSEDVWLCTLAYPNEAAALRAHRAVHPVLAECTFIATEES